MRDLKKVTYIYNNSIRYVIDCFSPEIITDSFKQELNSIVTPDIFLGGYHTYGEIRMKDGTLLEVVVLDPKNSTVYATVWEDADGRKEVQ